MHGIDYCQRKQQTMKKIPDIILAGYQHVPGYDGWEFMEEMSLIKSEFNKKIIVYCSF
jgi:rhodanese-related sulfurtransferase